MIRSFIDEVVQRDIAEYVVIAHAGHGINSWAMHYFLVSGPVALFVQKAWGGAYMDRAQGTRAVNETFTNAESFVEASEKARADGKISEDERIVVQVSDFYDNQWARLRSPAADSAAVDWQQAEHPMAEVIEALSAPSA
jgi:hypothetical protein